MIWSQLSFALTSSHSSSVLFVINAHPLQFLKILLTQVVDFRDLCTHICQSCLLACWTCVSKGTWNWLVSAVFSVQGLGDYVFFCVLKATISMQCTFHTILIFVWGSLHTRCYTHCVMQLISTAALISNPMLALNDEFPMSWTEPSQCLQFVEQWCGTVPPGESAFVVFCGVCTTVSESRVPPTHCAEVACLAAKRVDLRGSSTGEMNVPFMLCGVLAVAPAIGVSYQSLQSLVGV